MRIQWTDVFAYCLLGKQEKTKHRSPDRPQQPQELKKEGEEQEGEVDYRSDFESESKTEPGYSASQVSEHLSGDGEEVVSEVKEEASESDVSHGRTEDDYSSNFTDSQTSDRSQRSFSRSRDSRSSRSSRYSRSSVSHSDQESSRLSRKHTPTRKKEAAVQTQPSTWSSG